MKYKIYIIKNLDTGKSYIGMTKQLKHRISVHVCSKTEPVQGKYIVETLVETDELSEASDLEAYYTHKLNTIEPFGYNKREGGRVGYKHSEETKKKIGAVNLGKRGRKVTRTPEWTEKQRQSLLKYYENNPHPFEGKNHSEETKKLLSEKAKGHTRWLGRKHSEETKKKMSAAKKGCIPWSLGKKMSEETKKKISQTKLRNYILKNP